ncbi:MAG: hypothetical protein V7731_09895 [Amphritea sp.]
MSNRDDRIELPKALKQHFAAKQLSEQQLAKLQRLQSERQSESETTEDPQVQSERLCGGLRCYRLPLSAAGAVLLAILLALTFNQPQSLTESVVAEIAFNHNQDVPVEVESSTIPFLVNRLSKLEFALIRSARLSESKWQLLGGRYCMINGRLAVQIKIRHLEQDRIYTLYQASLPKGLSNLNSIEQLADGVRVKLWQEQGLLLGLAGDD